MDVADQIHAANTQFTEAVRAKDAAVMPTLYTKEGQILPPNGEVVRGDEAIVAFWQGLFDLGLADARPVTLEIIPMGDLAVEVGENSVFGENGVLLDSGKIMVVWKLEDGDWKMHRDMWNSSVPLPDANAETH
jgi:ketosteroid isomerase-like protein